MAGPRKADVAAQPFDASPAVGIFSNAADEATVAGFVYSKYMNSKGTFLEVLFDHSFHNHVNDLTTSIILIS